MRRRLTWVTLFSIAIVVVAMFHVRKVHAPRRMPTSTSVALPASKGPTPSAGRA